MGQNIRVPPLDLEVREAIFGEVKSELRAGKWIGLDQLQWVFKKAPLKQEWYQGK